MKIKLIIFVNCIKNSIFVLRNKLIMDIQTRKIEFIQEFLKLQSEELILLFEQLLKITRDKIKPMDISELNARIDISENDFKNNRYKTTEEILSKY